MRNPTRNENILIQKDEKIIKNTLSFIVVQEDFNL
jgi:hypothetical protein